MNFDQASQDAQTTGDARVADYTNKANNFAGQYSNYQGQANAANQNIQNQNAYMQGAGSANNLYNNAFDQQSLKSGYNLGNMQSAQNNLAQAQGSQSAYNDFADTAASKWGLNAGGFAAANAGATQGLNNNIQSAGAAVAKQQQNFQNAQTGANQQTGLNLQQQSMQLQGYKNAFDSAYQQQQQSQSTMLAYQKMAQDQGGLTAQQVQGYQQSKALSAQANASLASAQASIAQAKLSTSQASYQDISNQQANAYGNSKAYQSYLNGTADKNGTPTAPPTAPPTPQPQSNFFNDVGNNFNNASNWLDTNVNNPIGNWWNSLPTSSIFGGK